MSALVIPGLVQPVVAQRDKDVKQEHTSLMMHFLVKLRYFGTMIGLDGSCVKHLRSQGREMCGGGSWSSVQLLDIDGLPVSRKEIAVKQGDYDLIARVRGPAEFLKLVATTWLPFTMSNSDSNTGAGDYDKKAHCVHVLIPIDCAPKMGGPSVLKVLESKTDCTWHISSNKSEDSYSTVTIRGKSIESLTKAVPDIIAMTGHFPDIRFRRPEAPQRRRSRSRSPAASASSKRSRSRSRRERSRSRSPRRLVVHRRSSRSHERSKASYSTSRSPRRSPARPATPSTAAAQQHWRLFQSKEPDPVIPPHKSPTDGQPLSLMSPATPTLLPQGFQPQAVKEEFPVPTAWAKYLTEFPQSLAPLRHIGCSVAVETTSRSTDVRKQQQCGMLTVIGPPQAMVAGRALVQSLMMQVAMTVPLV